MAEYAGLEIRIGGNTTKLTNALKAPTKSAAELQSRIRQITRAMQFDPTNLKNVDTRIKITGDRMQSLQSKAQLAKTAMQQLGDSTVKLGGKDKTIRDIANETTNLSLKAKQADERFNGLTGTLAKIYESWNNLSRSSGVEFLTKNLDLTNDEAERLMRSSTSVREFVSELREIQSIRSSLTYDGGKAVFTDKLIEDAKKFKELDFHGMFKRGLDLDDMIEEAGKLGVVIEDSAIANVRELQKTFKEAQADKKAFDDALQFEQLGTDVQRFESEIEGLSQTMRKLDDSLTPTTMSDDFQAVETEVRKIDAALDNVEQDLKRTGEAMKADPGNIELAARYMGDLQQKASLSEEKVNLLKKQMDMLDADGAAEAAKGHQDLAKWVEESAEAARTAQKDLSNQQATVANLNDQVKGLKQTVDTLKGDSTITEYSDNVIRWKKSTEKLTQEMGELEKAERNVATEQKKLGEAQGNFDKAEKEADEYKRKLDELKAEQKQLMAVFEQGDPSTDFGSVVQRLNELDGEIEQVDAAYKGAQVNVKEFNRQLKDQAERANTAQSTLEQQRDKVNDLKQSVSDLEKTSDVKLFKNPTGEIDKAEGELKELRGELDKAIAKENELEDAYDSAKTENELAKTAQAARNVSQDMEGAQASLKKTLGEMDSKGSGILNASTIKSLGMTLSATVTPVLAGIGYKMIDASSQVDSAYRDMRKTVEGTEEQFEHLKSAAIEFSRTHVTSADQILSIEAIGGELGIATENLETFAEVISNLDVATNLDTEGAAETLGHLANIIHLSEEDYVGFSDALVRLGNNGASTETEIANIAERIGSMASIVGMSASDTLAFASTIASTGQNAEAAGTAISRTMSFFETAVSAAAGTMDTSFEAIDSAVRDGGDQLTVFASLSGRTVDEFVTEWEEAPKDMAATIHDQVEAAKGDLQMIADVAHMSSDEFARTWESDPTTAMKAFIEGLNDLEGAGGSADKVLQDLGIKAVRQKQAIEGLMQTVGGLDDNLKMSEDAWNGISDQWGEAGDAANEASKKAEGFSGQLQILKNMAQTALAELGEGAAPWIGMLADQLGVASSAFSSLSTEAKKWIVLAGGLLTAAGPVMSIGASFITAKKDITEWYETTTDGMSIVKAALKHGVIDSADEAMTSMDKLKTVGLDLGSSLLKGLAVGAVVVGIGLIISELSKLYQKYKDHEAATKGFSDALANVGKAAEITSDGSELVGSSLRELAADSENYESRLADLAKTIEDSNRQYSTFAGQMDYYASTIETLGSKSERTEDETYKLEAALNAVNDACNTTYGLDEYGNIIDTQTGKIQENTDIIKDNIDARKEQALIDYYSDDYTKAVGKHQEALDKLADAQDKYDDLTKSGAKEKYLAHVKEVYGATYDEQKALAAYNKEVQDAQTAIGNYQVEANKAGDALSTLETKISGAQEKLDAANKTLEDAAAAEAEYATRMDTVTADVTGNMKRLSDAVSGAGEDDAGFNAIVNGLDAIKAGADELNGVDMSALAGAFDSTSGSMEAIVTTLEEGGVQMNSWNEALAAAPEAADNMSTLTAAAFQTMYDSAGQNLNDTMTLIAGLDTVQVGDKTFYIGDNGSITDAQGKVYDINNDIAEIPAEVVTQYYVDDKEADKKIAAAEKKRSEYAKRKTTAKIDAQDNASKKVDTAKGKLIDLGKFKATPSAYLNDYASSVISDINRSLNNLNGKTATTYVKTVKTGGKQATGGYNTRPVIPEHAQGYIATGPTLTNQGWIGEDGIEAVANWATGGAVVPLTNKKYMLPIADAIADGMTARMGPMSSGPQISIVVNGVESAEETADAIARKLALFDL